MTDSARRGEYADAVIMFATASPRRKQLAEKIKYVHPDAETSKRLHKLGFSRVLPNFEPTAVQETVCATAAETAKANARLKGEHAARFSELPVLAFDTVVGLNDRVFGKPRTAAEAVGMFETLCGSTHEVITAVFFEFDGHIIEKNEKTLVTFGAFERETVYNYVESGAPFDKAGGYNIDDAEIKPLIAEVRGDYSNVVGLPIALTEKLIEEYLNYVENGYSR